MACRSVHPYHFKTVNSQDFKKVRMVTVTLG